MAAPGSGGAAYRFAASLPWCPAAALDSRHPVSTPFGASAGTHLNCE